jgi:hypothetical protein
VSLADLLVGTIRTLEAARIPYMLTGSLASTFHGEPRATRDIDIVIDPTPKSLDRLVDGLRADGVYVDLEAARVALNERGQFNAIAADAKVDFIIRKDRPFSIAEFERRQRVQLPGTVADVVTVEDLIVAKLLWAVETDSERQLRDVSGMIAVAGDALDRTHVTTWAERLGVGEAWRRLEGSPER